MDAEREKLKEDVIRADRGPFIGWWDTLLRVEPKVLRRVHEFLLVGEKATHISEKMRHLIWVAADIVVTHLYPRGAGVHASIALKCGATPQEVVQTLEIAASVSCRGFEEGLPIVLAAIEANQGSAQRWQRPLSAEEEALQRNLQGRLGFFSPWMEQTLRLWPDYLKALIDLGYSEVDSGSGLDAKSRELIFFGAHACPAIGNKQGMKIHAERALAAGATADELLQVLALANYIGLHSIAEGINTVSEHLANAEAAAAGKK